MDQTNIFKLAIRSHTFIVCCRNDDTMYTMDVKIIQKTYRDHSVYSTRSGNLCGTRRARVARICVRERIVWNFTFNVERKYFDAKREGI